MVKVSRNDPGTLRTVRIAVLDKPLKSLRVDWHKKRRCNRVLFTRTVEMRSVRDTPGWSISKLHETTAFVVLPLDMHSYLELYQLESSVTVLVPTVLVFIVLILNNSRSSSLSIAGGRSTVCRRQQLRNSDFG